MSPLFDKENRKDKQEGRQLKRDQKLDTRITQEARESGIDFAKLPSGPITSAAKARIDQALTKGASEDLIGKVSNFNKAYVDPNIQAKPNLDKEQLKRSLRKQKRAKIGDVIYALGQGMQGKEVDTSKFKSSKIEQERKDVYDKYKGVSQANKATAQKWEEGYREDLYKYLDELSQKKDTSDLEKLEIEKQKAYIDKIRAETARAKRPSASSSSKDDTPTYTYKTSDGQTLKMNVPKKDAYRFNKLKLDLDGIKRERDAMVAQMEDALASYTPSWGQTDEADEQDIRDEYAPLLAEYDNKIKDQEGQINKIFSGGQASAPSSATNPTQSKSDDEFGSFINKYQ